MDVYFGKFIYDVILAIFKHVVTPEKAEQIGKTWGNLTTFSRREVTIGVLSLTVGGVATGWYMRRSIRLQLEEAARGGKAGGGAGGDPFGMGGGLVKSGAGKIDIHGLSAASSASSGDLMNANLPLRQRLVTCLRDHWKVLPSMCTGVALVALVEWGQRRAWRSAETRLADKAAKMQEVDARLEYIVHHTPTVHTVLRSTAPLAINTVRHRTVAFRQKLKIAVVSSLVLHLALQLGGPPSVQDRGLFFLMPSSCSDFLFTVVRHSPAFVAVPEGLAFGAVSSLAIMVVIPRVLDRLTRPALVIQVAQLMTAFQPTPAQDVSPEMVAAAGGTRFSRFMDSHLQPLRGFLEEKFAIPPLQRLEATTILGATLQHSLSERRVATYLERSSLRSTDLRMLLQFFMEYPRIWLVTLVCEVMEDLATMVQRVDLPLAVQHYLFEWFKDGFVRKIPDALEVEDADVLLQYLEGKLTKSVLRQHLSVHISSRRMKEDLLPRLFRFPSLFATYIRNKEEKQEKEICELVVQLAERLQRDQREGGGNEVDGEESIIEMLGERRPFLNPNNGKQGLSNAAELLTDNLSIASEMTAVGTVGSPSLEPLLEPKDVECLQELVQEALLRKKFITPMAPTSTRGSPSNAMDKVVGTVATPLVLAGKTTTTTPTTRDGPSEHPKTASPVSSSVEEAKTSSITPIHAEGVNNALSMNAFSPLRDGSNSAVLVVPSSTASASVTSSSAVAHALPHSCSEAVVAFSPSNASSGWNIRNKLNRKNIPLVRLEKMKQYLQQQLDG